MGQIKKNVWDKICTEFEFGLVKTVDFAYLLPVWDYRVNAPVYSPYYFLDVFLLLSRIFRLGDNKRWRQSIYFGLIGSCVFCFASFGWVTGNHKSNPLLYHI